MPLYIRDETVNRLARKLATRKRVNKTEAVRLALENELRLSEGERSLRARVRVLQKRILSRPPTGFEADKKFYDALE